MNSPSHESLPLVLAALRQLGGYFTFKDELGEEYVVVRKADFMPSAAENQANEDVQLALTAVQDLAEDIDSINQTIALLGLEDQDEAEDVASAEPMAPPRRVRFEPIKGDLPPELQE